MSVTNIVMISNIFRNNSAYTGGAISLQYITGVNDTNNSVSEGVTIMNSTFSDNHADDGGAMYLIKVEGGVFLQSCVFDRGKVLHLQLHLGDKIDT